MPLAGVCCLPGSSDEVTSDERGCGTLAAHAAWVWVVTPRGDCCLLCRHGWPAVPGAPEGPAAWATAGRSVPMRAALGLQSCVFPVNVFRLSSQAVPENAVLRKVSAHVQGNWAMLEGERAGTACFPG